MRFMVFASSHRAITLRIVRVYAVNIVLHVGVHHSIGISTNASNIQLFYFSIGYGVVDSYDVYSVAPNIHLI